MLVKKSNFLFFYHRFQRILSVENIILNKDDSYGEQILAIPILFGQEVIISRDEFNIITYYTEKEYTEVEDYNFEKLKIFFKYGILLIKKHPKAKQFEKFIERENALVSDKWHIYSALYNFMTKWKNVDVKLSKEEKRDGISGVKKLIELNGLPLSPFHKVDSYESLDKIKLSDFSVTTEDTLFNILKNRRTTRQFDSSQKLSFEDFSKIIFYTFGVQGINYYFEDLPVLKKTSPSGGSLHPSEAYLLVLRVENLVPGYYHYDVEFNQLVLLKELDFQDALSKAVVLSAGQEYTSDCSFLTFISTRYYRSFWKYMKHSGAYLVTVRDTAHLCQTAYTICSYLNIGCFTAAINQVNIEEELGLDPYKQGVTAMFGCGIISDEIKNRSLQPKFSEYKFH